MHIVLIRFHMFFDDILLGRCSGISSGITFACISNKYLWHLAWLQIHYMTEKIHFPPFPSLSSSAQRRMCSGHLLTSRAQGDVWYTNYSVWTEPWKPGLKFNLFFCNFVFLLRSCSRVIECLCSLYLHVKTNIGSDSNIFATCMLHVLSCKTFRTGHKGVGIPNKILHWNVSWWLY